jgi:hypothetical protein
MKTNRGIEAFYESKKIELPNFELPILEPIPFKYIWDNFILSRIIPIKRLPRINYKPRKTTYKTVKRFSAKRNR